MLVLSLLQVRAIIEFPRHVFWAGHACFARANGLGHPCFAHRVVNQHAQNGDRPPGVQRGRRGPGGRLRWRTLRAARARRGVDGVHRLGRGRGAGGRQQQQRRLTFVFMLVWTQVFRARLTAGAARPFRSNARNSFSRRTCTFAKNARKL